MSYSLLQLTNLNGGAVAAGAAIPFGGRTAGTSPGCQTTQPFVTTLAGADTMTLNGKGYYKVTYNISAVATAAGHVTISLVANGATATPLYTATATAAAAGDTVNITIPYMTRLAQYCGDVTPSVSLQFISSAALTSYVNNAIFEKSV